jgi:hypothetical protein
VGWRAESRPIDDYRELQEDKLKKASGPSDAQISWNLSVMAAAQGMYQANLQHGMAPSQQEFRRCFNLARELILEERTPPRLRRVA